MARRKKKKAGIFRWTIRLGVLSLALLIGVGAVVFFNLNEIVKKGIETLGPQVTSCRVEVASVRLLPLAGSGSINGLTVGNPEGFDTPNAIHMEEASIVLANDSLMKDKVIIHSIKVTAPEITLEGGLHKNNLTAILANINQYVEMLRLPKTDRELDEPTKLQIDDLQIIGGVVKLELPILRGKAVNIALTDIHFTDLGRGPDGITAAEVAGKALREIIAQITLAAPRKIAAIRLRSNDGTAQTGGSVKEGLGGLFNRFKKD